MSNTIINTNVGALNSHRALMGVGLRKARASERLSTGQRINRAADNAVGLAISEEMRAQIRGLDQAERNSQDGVNLIKVADGAMQEMQGITQRIRELTVQAANDTLDQNDRNAIQLEIDALIEELETIIERTEFNGIPLFDYGLGEITEGGTVSVTITKTEICQRFGEFWRNRDWNFLPNGDPRPTDNLPPGWPNWSAWDNGGGAGSCRLCSPNSDMGSAGHLCPICTQTSGSMANEVPPMNITLAERTQILRYWIATQPDLAHIPITPPAVDLADMLTTTHQECGTSWIVEYEIEIELGGQHQGVIIQNGANFSERFLIPLPNFNTMLGEDIAGALVLLINSSDDIALGTHQEITDRLYDIDLAIQELSKHRAIVGASQNRLHHSINNVQAASENTSAAKSRIRDADMAQEMMNLTKTNVLQQAAASMLAQANQTIQRALELLY